MLQFIYVKCTIVSIFWWSTVTKVLVNLSTLRLIRIKCMFCHWQNSSCFFVFGSLSLDLFSFFSTQLVVPNYSCASNPWLRWKEFSKQNTLNCFKPDRNENTSWAFSLNDRGNCAKQLHPRFRRFVFQMAHLKQRCCNVLFITISCLFCTAELY